MRIEVIDVTVEIRDGLAEIEGPFDARLNEFYRSLPGGRWNTQRLRWTCQPTPAACYRIAAELPDIAPPSRVNLDGDVRRLAARFRDAIESVPVESQPAVRRSNSWRHQCHAHHFIQQRDAALLFMGMGTGKSKVVVDLIQSTNATRTLILCPVSVMSVWRREIEKHSIAPGIMDTLILDTGTTKRKAAAVKDWLTCRERPVVVVNYESAWRCELFNELRGWSWDLFVADESHRAKSHDAKLSKGAAALAARASRRLCLTGTPMHNSPLDIFGQFLLLDSGVFGTDYYRFRERYARMGGFEGKQVVGYRRQEELAARMRWITFEAGREVLDLPDAVHQTVTFSLGAKEREMQDDIADDVRAYISDGKPVTTPNGLVKLLRLQQITGGFVRDEEKTTHTIGDAKQKTLADLLADIAEPVVIFCRYRDDLRQIQDVTAKLGRVYGELSGERKDLTEHGTMPEGIDVLGVQHQAGGVGIDLTRARIAIYWNHPWSLGDYEQTLARVHRPGQSRSVAYYHLVATDSVDGTVVAALQRKEDVVESIVKQMRNPS